MLDEELCEICGRRGEEGMNGWKQRHSILCLRREVLDRSRNPHVLSFFQSRCCGDQEGVVVVDIFVTSGGRYPLPSVAVGVASCRPFLSWAKVSEVEPQRIS